MSDRTVTKDILAKGSVQHFHLPDRAGSWQEQPLALHEHPRDAPSSHSQASGSAAVLQLELSCGNSSRAPRSSSADRPGMFGTGL